MKKEFATREKILAVATSTFSAPPEYLWKSYPNYAIFRHPNKKWFGAVMDVERKKLGLSGTGKVDILAVQCDPIMRSSLMQHPGILPAYHMNKDKWISVLLDGTVDLNECCALLDMSYEITEKKGKHPNKITP